VSGQRSAVGALVGSLRDSSPLVGGAAVEALAALGVAAVGDLLGAVCTGKLDIRERDLGCAALVRIGAPAIPALLRHLRHTSDQVRSVSYRALRGLEWQAESDEDRVSFLIQGGDWPGLRSVGAPATAAVISAPERETYYLSRAAMIKLLAEYGTQRERFACCGC